MKQVVAVFADYLPTPPDRGLGMIFLATVSVFNVPLGGLFVYSPLAAITHFLGHFGFSFKFSMCYHKGLIQNTTI